MLLHMLDLSRDEARRACMAKYRITTHGIWTVPAAFGSETPKPYALVAYRDGDDAHERLLAYLASPEFSADMEGFDLGQIVGVIPPCGRRFGLAVKWLETSSSRSSMTPCPSRKDCCRVPGRPTPREHRGLSRPRGLHAAGTAPVPVAVHESSSSAGSASTPADRNSAVVRRRACGASAKRTNGGQTSAAGRTTTTWTPSGASLRQSLPAALDATTADVRVPASGRTLTGLTLRRGSAPASGRSRCGRARPPGAPPPPFPAGTP